MKEPESMDECFYFTRRAVGNGKIMAWVFKAHCPKCKKGMMGKPIEGGKVRIRAKEYKCNECGYTVAQEEYEPTLIMGITYTCPYCRHEGEATTNYKRKTFEGVQAYIFECGECKKKIGITKKMKKGKKKSEPDLD